MLWFLKLYLITVACGFVAGILANFHPRSRKYMRNVTIVLRYLYRKTWHGKSDLCINGKMVKWIDQSQPLWTVEIDGEVFKYNHVTDWLFKDDAPYMRGDKYLYDE